MALLPHNPDTSPFDPPPATVPDWELVTGWRYQTEPDPDNPGCWRPVAWVIVYPDRILTVDYQTHLCVRDSALYAPREV